MRRQRLRGGTAMKANGYKFVGAWFSPSDLEQIEKACLQAGYNKAPFLRAGAKKLALTILTPAPPIAAPKPPAKKRKGKSRGHK